MQVSAVKATLDKLKSAVSSAGTDYAKIYLVASIYAGDCAAIANSSSGTTPATPSAQLTKPGVPTIGTATPGTGEVAVAFIPPTDGAAAVSYTVIANDGTTATGNVSPITVRGLSNANSYTFTVTATNSAGTGPASAGSAPVKPN